MDVFVWQGGNSFTERRLSDTITASGFETDNASCVLYPAFAKNRGQVGCILSRSYCSNAKLSLTVLSDLLI